MQKRLEINRSIRNYTLYLSLKKGELFYYKGNLKERKTKTKKLKQNGTDSRTDNAIWNVEELGNTKEGMRSAIDSLKREGHRRYTESNRGSVGQEASTSNGTGIDEHPISNPHGKTKRACGYRKRIIGCIYQCNHPAPEGRHINNRMRSPKGGACGKHKNRKKR